MTRLARYDIPDIPRHVIQRGNNRGVTFVADEDYGFYLECLEDAAPMPRAVPRPWLSITALGPTPEARQSAYRALFARTLCDGAVIAIRDATHKAWPLGGDRFKEDLARLTERRIAQAKPGRSRKEEVAA